MAARASVLRSRAFFPTRHLTMQLFQDLVNKLCDGDFRGVYKNVGGGECVGGFYSLKGQRVFYKNNFIVKESSVLSKYLLRRSVIFWGIEGY